MSKRAMIPQYTLADVGCYVDGAKGIHVLDGVVEIAEAHGMDELSCWCNSGFYGKIAHGAGHSWSDCEFSDDIENDCDLFMNDTFAVEGAYWGRNDNGDWGLWAIDDE